MTNLQHLHQIFIDIVKALSDRGVKQKMKPTQFSNGIYMIPIANYGIDEQGNVEKIDGIVRFDGVNSIDDYGMYKAFVKSNITKVYFPDLQSIGSNGLLDCFSECQYLTEIHFKQESRSEVQSTAGYSNNFGAVNAQIFFDL